MNEEESDTEYFFNSQFGGEARKSKHEYNWIIYFTWDINDQQPFKCVATGPLGDTIPKSWIYDPLTDNCRIYKRSLRCLGSHQYSIFCKIQSGNYIVPSAHSEY